MPAQNSPGNLNKKRIVGPFEALKGSGEMNGRFGGATPLKFSIDAKNSHTCNIFQTTIFFKETIAGLGLVMSKLAMTSKGSQQGEGGQH